MVKGKAREKGVERAATRLERELNIIKRAEEREVHREQTGRKRSTKSRRNCCSDISKRASKKSRKSWSKNRERV